MYKPIIKSLFDLDFYKLTMAQIAYKKFSQVPVTFSFKNRTSKIDISKFVSIQELIYQFDSVLSLKFRSDELDYLESLGFFAKDFLLFLKNLSLPSYSLTMGGNGYKIMFKGRWAEVTFWETICLSIINELYYRNVLRKMPEVDVENLYSLGRDKLTKKIEIIKANPEIVFSEFGTRRRFSQSWQEEVIGLLANNVGDQLLGTSNVYLAKKYGLRPIGTFAHEMYMVMSGIMRGEKEGILRSHNTVLDLWWEEYGERLSIALTDTYGSDFFFRDMSIEQAENWGGLRHDSGDPIEFGEKAIRFYLRNGVDPKTKTIVFSDGLNVESILKISKRFKGRIKYSFGWGTNLTNDLGLGSLSMVVKATRSNGYGTVKLSDNLAKAMGSDSDIELFKKIFGHSVVFEEACVY